MALEPRLRYPAQILAGGADYPFGKARNLTVPGDGTGTPFEADLVNDWFGFFQSVLLFGGGINPSNTPDRVGASQYLDGLRFIATRPLTDIFAPGVHTASVTIDNGTFLGDDFNILAGESHFVGVQLFEGDASFQNEVDFGITGIVIGATGVTIGNGIPGMLIQAGGIRVLVGNARFDDTAEFHKEIVLADEGRIRTRSIYAANADTHYDVTQGDVLVIMGAGIAASRIYTLDATGASDGSTLEIRNHDSHTHTIKNNAGTTIATVAVFGPTAGKVFCRFEDNGTGLDWTA